MIRQLFPSIADIDAMPTEAEQHRTGILHIDVDIWIGGVQRRAPITEAGVV
jgi:hypothetical protein